MVRNTVNRIAFGVALFVVLTMVIPAPSSVFPSLIQPASQVSKPAPVTLPKSLFSVSNAAAFSTGSSFPPIIANSSFSTINTTPKIVGTTQANTTVKLFDGTTQIGSVTRNLASAGQIFTMGGRTGGPALNTADKYNPDTNTWSAVAPMPTARISLASATDLSGNIYAIGGSNGGPLATVEKYNPGTNTWSTVTSMPTARQQLAAAADLSGNIYAIGGDNANGTIYNNVEKYNPGTNTWSTVAPMPAPSSCLGAVADPSGNIYALGGAFNNVGTPVAFKYNPTTNTWTGLPPIPSPPLIPGCPGGVASDLSGNIYVMGGFSVPSAVYQSAVEKYDPGTNTWSTVASLPASDAFFSAATDLNGNIYAIGGATPISSTVYKYNPGTNIWSTVASLPQAVSNLAATTPFMAQWSITTPALSLGAHTIRANATDAASNTSPNSASITVTVNAPPTVPSQTTGLTATAISSSQINLSWTAPSDGGSAITGYKIERESPVGGGFSTLVANTGSTATIYPDTGLTPSTQYNYRVTAINAIGPAVTPSSPASATTTSSTITAAASGNWNVGSTWTGGIIPSDNDNAIIPNGITVTIPSSYIVNVNPVGHITINLGGTLFNQGTLNNIGTISISGTFTTGTSGQTSNNPGGTINNSGSINIDTNSPITLAGPSTFSGRFANTGTLTLNPVSQFNIGGGSSLAISSGTFTIPSGVSMDISSISAATVSSGANISLSGTITNEGSISGAGTLLKNCGSTLTNTGTLTVTVQSTCSPTISITSPVNGTTISTSSTIITGTASDNVAVASVQVSIDGGAYIPATNTGTGFSTWSISASGLSNEIHTIQVKATDSSGNNGFSFGSNKVLGSPIPAGSGPYGEAFDPANGYLYEVNINSNSVSVINGATNQLATGFTNPIPVGANPLAITFNPANGYLYVTNTGGNSVSVINGATNQLATGLPANPIPVGAYPNGIVYDPANGYIYVVNANSNSVSIINGATNAVVGLPISVGNGPNGIAYNPTNGNFYVSSSGDNSVYVINGATNALATGLPANPIPVGAHPAAITYDPANGYLYIANYNANTISVINGATNTVLGSAISVGVKPEGVAYDPANGNLYVTNSASNSVSVINGTTNTILGSAIQVQTQPIAIAYDSANGGIYVANAGSGSVSIISTPTLFTVNLSSPVLDAASPTSGLVGQTVAVNFNNLLANHAYTVTIASITAGGAFATGTTNSTGGAQGLVAVPVGATPGAQTLAVTDGTNTISAPFTVTAPVADYTVSASHSVSAVQGTSGGTDITVGSINGFASPVSLALSGGPIGVSGIFVSSALTPPTGGLVSTTLTLTVPSSIPAGTYTLTVTGTSGTFTRSTTFALTVNPSLPPGDYSLSATPAVIVQGNNGPATVTATSISGFNSPITFSTNATNGITGTFSTNPLTPPVSGQASTSLLLSISSLVPAGTYHLGVTGTSGTVSHSTVLPITVTPSVPFGVSALSPTQSIVLSSDAYVSGSSGTITINSNAGTPTIQALIRSSSDPIGMLVTLTQSSTNPIQYVSNTQITFASSDTGSSNLHVDTGDTIFATYGAYGSVFYPRAQDGSLFNTIGWGVPGDIPVVGDWAGTGHSQVGVYRPSAGAFYLRAADGSLFATIGWGGAPGDIPVVGDWAGIGKSQVGVYRPSAGAFYLRAADGSLFSTIGWGNGIYGDIPVVGDWAGIGKSQVGVYRPSAGAFYLRAADGSLFSTIGWGNGIYGDIPVVGDWAGIGHSQVGVFRPSADAFYLRAADGSLFSTIGWGVQGDMPVVGDWAGTGHSQVGVYRPVLGGQTTTATIITNTIPTAGVAVDTTVKILAGCTSTSNDGICDTWKTPNGIAIPYNGATFNFACTPGVTYASDPLGDQVCPILPPTSSTKDLYVEIDYMTGHRPDNTALTDVVNAFLHHNIHLHLLVDEDMALHVDSIPITTALNSDGSVQQTGYFGASGSQGYKQGYKDMFFGTAAERANPQATNLLDAKRQFYHYTMFVHDITGTGGSSGYGEIGGNDIIISLGEFTNHVGSIAEQEGTFMHELGHNLGLDHGGPQSINGQLVLDHSLNCKPNYPSVMNYLYQLPVLVPGRPLDFSSLTATNTLNENNLVPSSGIGESLPQTWQAVIGGLDSNNNYQSPLIAPFTGGVDFARSGFSSSTTPISKNIHLFNIPNCDTNTNSVTTTLNGYDDWDNLNFNFRSSNTFYNGIYTINAVDLSATSLRTIQGQLVASLNGTIESLPDVAFAPNSPSDSKSTFSSELLSVDSAIRAGNLIGPGSAAFQLQNMILPKMTGTGTASTGVLITNPTYQQQVSSTVNDIISALVAAGTPSATDHLKPTAANETIVTTVNTPVGITLLATDPSHLSLQANITNPSSGTLSPAPTGLNLDFSGFSSMTYVSTSNFVGFDHFTYQVKSTDPLGITRVSSLGTVTIITKSATTTALTSSANPSTAGQSVTFTATVSPAVPNGNSVVFSDGAITIGTGTTTGSVATLSTSSLVVGAHLVTAQYLGDTGSTASTSNILTQTVNPITATTQVQLNPSSVIAGGTITATAQVSGFSPSGTVSFSAPSGTFSANSCTLNNGACSVSYTSSTAGTPSITAAYSGDANNLPNPIPSTSTLTVSQATTTTQVSLNPSSVVVNGLTIVTAQVSGFLPGGTISFTSNSTGSFNSTSCTIHNNQCAVQYTPSVVANGFHKITSTYSGDTNNVASSSNAILGVSQTVSSEIVSINPSAVQVGGSSQVSVTINGFLPTGTITFSAPQNSGQFNSTTCTLKLGTCGVTFNALASPSQITIGTAYSGDTNNQPSSSASTLTITQATTTTQVSLNPSSVVVNGLTIVTAQVSGFLPGGTISFTSNSTGSFNSTSCTIHNNQCAVQYTPSVVANGFHKITSTYSGDTNNVASSSSSTLSVTKFVTTTQVQLNPSSVVVNSPTVVTAQVSGFSPSGTISFASDGTGSFNSTSCTIHNNQCAVQYTPSAVGTTGLHKITATYSSDANNVASSGISTLGVTQTTPSEIISINPSTVIVGHASQVSVTINGFSPTGTITFSAPQGSGSFTPQNSCQLNNGACFISFTPSISGQVTITANYPGDTNNKQSSSTGILTVSQATTTTLISLNPSAVPAGGTTTVTAQVSGFSPSGTVSFSTSSGSFTPQNSCQLNNGACSVSYTAGTSGQVTITASYPGDANNKQSSGNTILNVALLQAQKNSIASNIKNLESGITDKDIVTKLDRAALHVQNSASNNLWNTDGNTLVLKKGNKVFNQEANSVNILLKLILKPTSDDSDIQDSSDDSTHDHDLDSVKTSTLPSDLVSSIQTIVNQLVSIDSSLAQGQISSANAYLSNLQSHNAKASTIKQVQDDISQANSFVQKAQSDIASGNFHRAIFDYRESWAQATNALQIK